MPDNENEEVLEDNSNDYSEIFYSEDEKVYIKIEQVPLPDNGSVKITMTNL